MSTLSEENRDEDRLEIGWDPRDPSRSDGVSRRSWNRRGLGPERAEYVTPSGFCEEEVKNFAASAAWAKEHNEDNLMPHFETSGIAPQIDDFITKTEARAKR